MLKAKWFTGLCKGVVALLILSACGGRAADSQPKSLGGVSLGEHRVISTVNGEDIYEDVFMEWYLQTMAISQNLDLTEEQDDYTSGLLDMYKYSFLSSYVEMLILLQDAARNEIVMEDAEIEEKVLEIIGLFASDEEGFLQRQAAWGFRDDGFRRYVKNEMTIQLLYQEMTQAITEPEMTPEEYYNAYPGLFRVDETRTVRHILVEEREEAQEIISSLLRGADFGAMVSERSIDYGSALYGGVIGPFDVYGNMTDGGSLIASFTDASFALAKEGDFTQTPVASEYGYHIIILDEITQARVQSFDEVRDALAYELLMEARDDYFNGYYQQVVDAAVITYADDIPLG